MNELIANPATFHELPVLLRIFALAFLCILAISLIAWQILIIRLYRRLASAHPQTYDSLGRPSLWWSNSPRAQWELFHFILWKDYLPLADPELTKLCISIRTLFGVYFFILFAIIIGIGYLRMDISTY